MELNALVVICVLLIGVEFGLPLGLLFGEHSFTVGIILLICPFGLAFLSVSSRRVSMVLLGYDCREGRRKVESQSSSV